MSTIDSQILADQIKEARFTEFSVENFEGKMAFVATDETVDREGEILSIEGWDLENFKRNPVMLWAHNPYEPPIGKWTNIRMRTVNGKKKLMMEPDFHKKSDLSRLISDLVENGYPPQTVSVGFRPKERQGNRYVKQELLETSFVNVPANPEATTLALTKGYSSSIIKQVIGEDPELEKIEQDMSENEMLRDKVKYFGERIILLQKKLTDLEVAHAKPTEVASPIKNAGNKTKTKRLMQLANKALDEALRLEKLR